MTDAELNAEDFRQAVLAAALVDIDQKNEFYGRCHSMSVERVMLNGSSLVIFYRLEGDVSDEERSFKWSMEPHTRRPDGVLRDPDEVAFDAWGDFEFELVAPPQGRHCCRLMAYYLADEDNVVQFWERVQEYAVPVRDGGSSGIVMKYCPWCGTKLPPSLREIVFADHAMSDEFEMLDDDEDEEDGNVQSGIVQDESSAGGLTDRHSHPPTPTL